MAGLHVLFGDVVPPQGVEYRGHRSGSRFAGLCNGRCLDSDAEIERCQIGLAGNRPAPGHLDGPVPGLGRHDLRADVHVTGGKCRDQQRAERPEKVTASVHRFLLFERESHGEAAASAERVGAVGEPFEVERGLGAAVVVAGA